MAPHLQQFWHPLEPMMLRGVDRLHHLQRLTSQDLRPLAAPLSCADTLLLTPQGRLVDWVQVVSLPDQLVVVGSPGRAGRVADWVRRYTITEDVQLSVAAPSSHWRLQLIGPGAVAAAGLAGAPSRQALSGQLEQMLWLPALPAWGEAVEAWVAADKVEVVRRRLAAAGASIGDATQLERRRILAGIPSPAFEFADAVNPLELRLAAVAVGWNKGCYIGQEVISRQDSYQKVARLLVGISASVPPPTGAPVRVLRGDAVLGRLTSCVPDAGGTAALAVVKVSAAQPQPVELVGPTARWTAAITLPPFCQQLELPPA